ncbi:hypothetical protein [Rhodopirellula sp. MGV]|uniref:hypothetical protein n=1 Tax=Rhodopirellula sp. MGV TaxID=2023130 RepID=UPI000B96723E|nr:hypothetical protein [Rhodopirellula sp. MGV]OYP37699.1 hypothetical protein CGZ80_04230 [Rhodopirellula sp. MGV]PNY37137.1 hypothetical protein C2E31_09085 [Rhodopirellula baltica]
MTKFYAIQFAVLITFAGIGFQRQRQVNHRPVMPQLRDRPRVVGPLYDYPLAVTDEQLQQVLYKLRPRFLTQPTKINFIDHSIRMWGPSVDVDDDSLSGKEMLTLLLDHQAFGKVWDPTMPLLKRVEDGIAVSTQVGRTSVSHVDHMIGTLCEIGIPRSQPLRAVNGMGTVGEILEYGLKHFRLNQREYEWTSLATAFYAIDGQNWFTREGQAVDFNTFADRLMRQDQPEGVCYGQHRLYTLTMLLRIDDQVREEGLQQLLHPETRQSVIDYLLVMNQRLLCSQSAQGFWDGNWPNAVQQVPDPATNETSRRILATGHVLEWWAMAPQELVPPREIIIRASQWLAREIIAMDEETVEKNYTFLSHAGRALALWRGGLPSDFIRAGHQHVALNP